MGGKVMIFQEINLFYPKKLFSYWMKKKLQDHWKNQYPMLFDKNDYAISKTQPNSQRPTYHFGEWFTAIYFLHTYGYFSLVEKYFEDNHKG